MPRLLYTRILSGDTLYKSLYAYTQIPVDEEEYTRTVRCAFVAERKMRLRDGRWASQRNDFFFNRLKMWRVRFLADEVDLDLFVVSSSQISLSPPFWDRGGWMDRSPFRSVFNTIKIHAKILYVRTAEACN